MPLSLTERQPIDSSDQGRTFAWSRVGAQVRFNEDQVLGEWGYYGGNSMES